MDTFEFKMHKQKLNTNARPALHVLFVTKLENVKISEHNSDSLQNL